MLGRTDRRMRVALLLVFLVLFSGAATVRMAYWQVVRADELRQRASGQLERATTAHAVRGDILDRDGTRLATTAYRDRLVAYPNLIEESRVEPMAEALAVILELDREERDRLLEQLAPGDLKRYATLDRELTTPQSEQVRAGLESGEFQGLGLEAQPVRQYLPGGAPGTSLASHLLGFVQDGRGQYGIEQRYDSVLAGRSASGSEGASASPGATPGGFGEGPAKGQDIRISIDASLQLRLERELYAAWVADAARRVTAVILEPETGAVLAWASVPGYDANQPSRQANRDMSAFSDPIVSQVYEPGSVMKMLTAAAALDAGTVTLGSAVRDGYALTFGPNKVTNFDNQSQGRIAFRDAIAYSRNVATARTAARLGRTPARSSQILYRTWQRLGIGQRTGIDIAGESAGIAADPSDPDTPWQPVDLANRSFGQSVAVTQIQLATAYAPMINGGLRVQPHFLLAVGDREQASPAPQRVFRVGLANQLRSLLDHVTAAVPGYAAGSLVRGYHIGGKTGTAQIWLADQGKYSEKVFDFSMVGYVGGDAPQAVIAVRIQEPRANGPEKGTLDLYVRHYDLFRRVARATIGTLDIRRSSDPRAGCPELRSAAAREHTPGYCVEEPAAATTRERADRDPTSGGGDAADGRDGRTAGDRAGAAEDDRADGSRKGRSGDAERARGTERARTDRARGGG